MVQAEPVTQQIGEVEANVKNQAAMIEQAQARLNQANLNLSYTVLRAASDGTVTRRQGVSLSASTFFSVAIKSSTDFRSSGVSPGSSPLTNSLRMAMTMEQVPRPRVNMLTTMS